MKLDDNMLKRLQQEELEILKEFVGVCEKLNLKYYIIGGTLLGAVRHGGFIPWDDDIDIGMPRKDYEVFIKEAQELLPAHYFIQNLYTEPGFVQNFTKLRNSNTTCIEIDVRRWKINHGICIDVFPLDYRVKHKELEKFYAKAFFIRNIILNEAWSENFFIRAFVAPILKLFFPLNKLLRYREEMYKSGTDKEYLCSNCSATKTKFGSPAWWYGEGVPMKFEDIEVIAPSEYDKLLTSVYGDYMRLPPVEQQQGHHYVEAIDFEKSYKEYI